MRNLVALGAGTLFGFGLAISQMINPEKVLAFLDLAGSWDPSLAFVMGGGVAVTALTFPRILRRGHPALARRFFLPSRSDIDASLLLGSALFGIGWGLAGYCPGPALSAVTVSLREPILFVPAMAAGMLCHHWLFARPASVGTAPAAPQDG